jgi:23S rRNA (adenine2503-C2)-methyltransferase
MVMHPGPVAGMEPPVINLRNLDLGGTELALGTLGVPADVSRRVFAAVHRDDIDSLREAQPRIRGLSKAMAAKLDACATWPALKVLDRRQSTDGFLKYLFRLADGLEIEAVRIPLPEPAAARALRLERTASVESLGLRALPTAKYTVCLSSQAGCALACDFCETGRLGGLRNLETWEIVAQLRQIAREAEHPVRGVVFMGMGEPLLNYANVMRAGRIFSHPAGSAIAAKAISISTAGVVPMIERYIDERQPFRLIFSLGAPSSGQRAELMPIENRWPLSELIPALRAYGESSRQRVTIAYVAIGGVNTSAEHARQLGQLLSGIRIKLNLIDVVDRTGKYRAPTVEEMSTFRTALDHELGAPVVRRYSGGGEIGAACGTLSASQAGGAALAGGPAGLSLRKLPILS